MENLKIKNVKMNGNVILAPMAGFTNVAFRRLAREFGASAAITEMVSAKALLYNNQKSLDLLQTFEGESPCWCQIFGNDPKVIAAAVKLPCLDKFDIIDINMGCPAPKITSNGEGSALLLDIDRASEIIKAAVAATNKPITVKFRIGYTLDKIVAVEFAKMCERSGASAITVHGRTTSQGYSGKADMNIIREVKNAVSIPVIANGDCNSLEDYIKMLEQTGADAVMIGRGALGNPRIFSDIKGIPINKTQKQTLLEYIDYMTKYLPERQALLESRTHIMYFLKGCKGASAAKIEIVKAENMDNVKSIIHDFFE